ncbi:hypothetical protein DSO57_1033680 [Entomophthora muscae]|uniref:Uncharacterized protein n=1 Tax=Entomophthora muscae TaxID=34485 RepID=A0ACC2TBB6_9FUNG|nr:hypothetical protein DSO57_1033680 [Entomophthora muscae]
MYILFLTLLPIVLGERTLLRCHTHVYSELHTSTVCPSLRGTMTSNGCHVMTNQVCQTRGFRRCRYAGSIYATCT